MGACYRVAIIGTGRMGGLIEDEMSPGSFSRPYGHFSAYAAIPETEVVAVANRGAERPQRFCGRFGVTNAYLDYREMIEQERPDIVSVTTPSFTRAAPRRSSSAPSTACGASTPKRGCAPRWQRPTATCTSPAAEGRTSRCSPGAAMWTAGESTGATRQTGLYGRERR